jgi:glycosyltransferase involved in cell wall biosynthesis
MKVLHICPGYFGTQLYDNLFRALQYIDIECEVFVCVNKKVSQNDEKPYPLKVLNKDFNKLERLLFFGKQSSIFNNICQEFQLSEFNIVHAHTLFSSGYSAYLLHKKTGLPYIVAIRNQDVNIVFKYFFNLQAIGNDIMNNAQNIIFLSPAYRNFVIDKYVPRKNRQLIFEKSVVIPNGIDDYFLNNKRVVGKATDKNFIKLIFIGDIDSNRNIMTTIKACNLLIEMGYSVNYTIVGEVLETRLKKIIAKNSFIDYHPKCSKEEVVLYLRNSDIFIMPSVLETFGLVYAEAMSQGLPVIYSKGQGFDGQFEDGVIGYSVNCFDYKDIAKKIIDLYNHYRQFSEQCVTLVEKFDWLKIANEYKGIYSSSVN